MINSPGAGGVKREEEFELRGYFRVIKKRYRYVVGFFSLVFFSALIFTQLQQPYYRATTQLLVERNNQTTLMTQYGYIHDPYFLNTQIEVIKSKNVIHRVIRNLDLNTRYRDHFLKQDEGRDGAASQAVKALRDFLTGLAGRAGAPAPPVPQGGQRTDTDKIAKAILKELRVEPVNETNVVNIAFDHPSPEIARMLVNAIAESYMDELLEVRMKQAGRAVNWMSKKAEEERKKIEEAEQALQDYTRSNDLVSEEDKLAVIPQQLKEYSTLLSQARAKRKELEDMHEQIERLGEHYEAIENLPEFAEKKDLQLIREKIFQAGQNMAALSKKIGEKHPDMIKARQEYELLRGEREFLVKRLVDSVVKEYELAKSNEKNFEQLIADTKLELVNIDEKLIRHNILKREVESNRILYEALIAKMKETSATEQTQTVNVAILEYAIFPEKPARPKKMRNILLAVIVGLFGGVGVAALREHLDDTVGSVSELEERFEFNVLGAVERFAKADAALSGGTGPEARIVAESYKMIRTELSLGFAENNPRIFLCTSGVAGEGKTVTCVNLGKALALEGKSVVLVDADLRAPALHAMFQLDNQTGLAAYLAGQEGSGDIVRPTSLPGVSVIPAGPIPDNPTELLESQGFKDLLGELAARFDCILLDSPDLLGTSDARILGTMAGATILVVRSGATTREQVHAVRHKLAKTGMQLAGVVLNGVES